MDTVAPPDRITIGKIEAAHVRTGTDGAMGIKPSDCHAIPLCAASHASQHSMGESGFEKLWKIDMKARAEWYWNHWLKHTPMGKTWEGKR